jgi:hypothetical protein
MVPSVVVDKLINNEVFRSELETLFKAKKLVFRHEESTMVEGKFFSVEGTGSNYDQYYLNFHISAFPGCCGFGVISHLKCKGLTPKLVAAMQILTDALRKATADSNAALFYSTNATQDGLNKALDTAGWREMGDENGCSWLTNPQTDRIVCLWRLKI